MNDESLADEASIIAEIEIVNTLESRFTEPPSTEYLGIVRRVLKGELDQQSIIVQVPGGRRPDGWELHLAGVPVFEAGEKALLFLLSNEDGTYGILHWALGTFRLIEYQDRSFAARDLAGSRVLLTEDQQNLLAMRDYEKFVSWLEERGKGSRPEADYFEPVTSSVYSPAYKLMKVRGKPIRWFDFDEGNKVAWRFRKKGSMSTRKAFKTALKAWNNESETPVKYQYAGSTKSTMGFLAPDGINAIIFGDPNNSPLMGGQFRCGGGGGLLAFGGAWAKNALGKFNGKKYRHIVEADIVVNAGVKCWLDQWGRSGAEELLAHELGHTLGIDHSCGDPSPPCTGALDEALMRPWAHTDGRGATLYPDDRAALQKLYAPELVAPSKLKATAASETEGQLSWKDNSDDETAFEIKIKIGSGTWKPWSTQPANTTGTGFHDATPGKTYRFKVRAIKKRQNKETLKSRFSNVAKVKMPEDKLHRPTNMQAWATSNTKGQLSWNDNSDDETAFEIRIKVGGGSWNVWSTKPANTTGTGFQDATPGTTYRFKVRAKKGQKVSAFSNVAKVTMPIGTRDCGNFTCQANYACCVQNRTCCLPEYPHYCANTNLCYQYFNDAQAACGNSYEICGGPVSAAGHSIIELLFPNEGDSPGEAAMTLKAPVEDPKTYFLPDPE